MLKLAIITSHPVQYYAPWFRYLAQNTSISIRVFYLWNFGITQQSDPDFQTMIQWDIPLLEGYAYEFVPNIAKTPGTSHFSGLQNPTLVQQVRQYDPDIVLMMNYNYASLYHFLWRWQDAPLIFRGDSHRLLPQRGWKAHLKRQWISWIYQRFAACLYVGTANYHYFREHGVPGDRLFFAPHTVDNDRFFSQSQTAAIAAHHWKQELGIPAHYRVILFAGKFNTKKRPLDLLNAFVQANLPETALLFVGAGELEQPLRHHALHHPHIYFAPFQNQSQMPRTYAIADLFVLPSYGTGETWGLAVNEAMCLGKPIIVSNHVGCAANLVIPEQNGLIFPAGDVVALTDCLRRALANPDRLQHWGDNSRQLIAEYDYSQTTQGLLQAIAATQ